jgi:type II secretory pathway component PulK
VGANKQAGVALALILWFIAALALLVAGLMGLSRVELSSTRLYLAQSQAASVGDAVALLVSRGMYRRTLGASSVLVGKQQFDAYPTTVRIVPADGLVDVVAADPELLNILFVSVLELEPSRARALVDSVIQWRSLTEEQKNQRRPDPTAYALEDIMLVPGLTRSVFERLRWFVCAGCNQGSFNWSHGPFEVKAALAGSSWGGTETGEVGASEWLQLFGAGRVDVRVQMTDGTIFQRSVWMSESGAFSRRYSVFRVKQLEFESNDFVQ